ncbi:MAG: TIGR04283 family arsenosugar biosynthesis glycosyltransferase [Pseudomonas sp.]|uniref:TIGR04283 family arsenosugar biosynthesis glycosyltransferase n=1 Tax=Pseudomonas sp. TaxID=306 RepID=UPI0027275531|nr:TIGR04283 family arsenosugar biosynthesis glycosyltransferase [Pseudomonas sp.]MDO9619846.1 TIGR04283 family arsenosugar biosynthesis glycosyltransferase [Pseudomonas sp.]MDP2447207.1 TIGR04283 family arsenosugar biosynthesis glycosyltransferase [Pseudomonas sp.]MDZ4335022.1 TIGR04283 family arsenosugar biosynthesis glycosyltransferase [Pseudomonas sp.]
MTPLLSVVIPVRNEAQALPGLLDDLANLRAAGAELILVDGGSSDSTCELALGRVDQLLRTAPGRALQMNAGAAVARGEYLWFVHADTRISIESLSSLQQALSERPLWGRFDVRLSGPGLAFRVIGAMICLRSRLSGIASGDQGIFVTRQRFEALGGYAPIPLMEDLQLCRRLKALARPRCLRPPLSTSSRRWEQHGIWRTVVLMWCLRLAYYCGASPEKLARQYRRGSLL